MNRIVIKKTIIAAVLMSSLLLISSGCSFVQKIPNGTSAAVVASESNKQDKQTEWQLLNSLAIYEGVTVNGVDVSNMNRLSAKALLEDKFDTELDNRSIELKFGEFDYKYSLRDLGYYYDYDAASTAAFKVAKDGEDDVRLKEIKALPQNPVDIVLEAQSVQEKLDEITAQIADDIHVDVINNKFKYDWDQGKVIALEGVPGRDVDLAKLREAMDTAVKTQVTSVEIPVQDVQPDPSYAAKADRVNGIIGEAYSSFGNYWARVENIRVSTQALDGVVIGPGETFSVNDFIGDTTPDKGYQMAVVILNNKEVPGYGGGVCQTSTCLYQAALRADLQILNRSPHSMIMPYAPTGLDATIEYGSADLVIRNPWDFPILIRSYYSFPSISFEIWGDTEAKNYDVSIWGEFLYSTPGAKHSGSAWATYRRNEATGETEYLGETVYPSIN